MLSTSSLEFQVVQAILDITVGHPKSSVPTFVFESNILVGFTTLSRVFRPTTADDYSWRLGSSSSVSFSSSSDTCRTSHQFFILIDHTGHKAALSRKPPVFPCSSVVMDGAAGGTCGTRGHGGYLEAAGDMCRCLTSASPPTCIEIGRVRVTPLLLATREQACSAIENIAINLVWLKNQQV
jgi:hypothetical protein